MLQASLYMLLLCYVARLQIADKGAAQTRILFTNSANVRHQNEGKYPHVAGTECSPNHVYPYLNATQIIYLNVVIKGLKAV